MQENILISGAGGSIGSELTRQLTKNKRIRKIVCVDFNEFSLFELTRSLKTTNTDIEFLCLNLSDDYCLDILDKYSFSHIYHSAAYKHVVFSEKNELSFFINNVGSTINLLKFAKTKKARFVQVSTDKAVQPINVMGYTKRLCEFLVLDEKIIDSKIVRFGNVLNSNGSVIPIFKNQIEIGGPVTVTHPDMLRFFMSINDAVKLILEENFDHKLLILNMGQQIKIDSIAKNMIEERGKKVVRAGQKEHPDEIEIVYTGINKGEKLQEKLSYSNVKVLGDYLTTDENLHPDPLIIEYIKDCWAGRNIPNWSKIDWENGCLI